MKILVAIDGSERSLAMLERLVRHFAWFREPPAVTLIHVHLPIPYKRAAAWAGKEAVHRYYEEEGDAALARARAILDGYAVAYGVEKRIGDPAHEIAAAAGAGGFDIIAMGTHGHTALANLVMGSVATKVLAASTVPVLLMK